MGFLQKEMVGGTFKLLLMVKYNVQTYSWIYRYLGGDIVKKGESLFEMGWIRIWKNLNSWKKAFQPLIWKALCIPRGEKADLF